MMVDLFWLRDERLEDTAGLPEPDVIAEGLQSALDQFAAIANDLKPGR
jgi:type I restriction enzyme M protein